MKNTRNYSNTRSASITFNKKIQKIFVNALD